MSALDRRLRCGIALLIPIPNEHADAERAAGSAHRVVRVDQPGWRGCVSGGGPRVEPPRLRPPGSDAPLHPSGTSCQHLGAPDRSGALLCGGPQHRAPLPRRTRCHPAVPPRPTRPTRSRRLARRLDRTQPDPPSARHMVQPRLQQPLSVRPRQPQPNCSTHATAVDYPNAVAGQPVLVWCPAIDGGDASSTSPSRSCDPTSAHEHTTQLWTTRKSAGTTKSPRSNPGPVPFQPSGFRSD